MSSKMNGFPLNEGSGSHSVLDIGASYCAKHIPQIPRLTREQIAKYATFPKPTAPKAETPAEAKPGRSLAKADTDRILELFSSGRTVEWIASDQHRLRSTVRKILNGAGINTNIVRSPKRDRIIALVRSGKTPEQAAEEAGAAVCYAKTIACKLRSKAFATDRRAA
jgi:hypothetical protein